MCLLELCGPIVCSSGQMVVLFSILLIWRVLEGSVESLLDEFCPD